MCRMESRLVEAPFEDAGGVVVGGLDFKLHGRCLHWVEVHGVGSAFCEAVIVGMPVTGCQLPEASL